jgi:outer membrane protein
MRKLQSALAILCAVIMAAPPSYAQDPVGNDTPSYGTQDTNWYGRLTRNYTPVDIGPINLTNSRRLESLVRAGRIYLSLQDAIALALENNLDIELQRYGPQIAQADLLRAQAGGLIRGVPASVRSGPSSAQSLQTGGTGTGAASVTSGTSASDASSSSGTIITTTGTQVPVLDETVYTLYTWGHRTQILPNTITTRGLQALQSNTHSYQFGVQKGFLLGTQVQFGYGGTNQFSNNPALNLNPFTSGGLNLQLTQPLLRGFGFATNSRFIRVAKNNVRVSDLVFKQQVIQTVTSIINLYSDLVSFNENVKVKQQALALNQKLYNDNKKQVEIGTLAPIEIVRAEAEVARSQQELTAAETQVLQQETIIKNALSRTGVSNPLIAEARIVPTDPLRIPDVEQVQPIQDLVALAIENRPEITQTDINLQNAKINLAGSKSQLLPQLDLIGSAQNNGLAGLPTGLVPIPQPDGTIALLPQTGRIVGGFGSVLSQVFSRNFPDYTIGFQLSVPLRNRAARADVIRDQLDLRQAEIRQRQQLNQVRVDVQNALIGLQQARAAHEAAVKSRVLQEQTLDAEQKKYALGASTIFFVIQAQRDLAQAQATEVVALSTYNRARVQMDLATGQTLKTYDINIDEAKRGQISRPPSAIPAIEPQGQGH